jgi:L-aminopeptidase/D-esterase-like protein
MPQQILLRVAVCSAAICAALMSVAHGDQSVLNANTSIRGPALTFDWPAVEIGVGAYEEGPTGLTIIRFANRASVTVDARGGGPGSVNTDLLRLGYGDPFVDAIVFSGGSAYGEEAITAVATGLKDLGMRSGDSNNLAIVPGAIIYDFGPRRLNEIYPDRRLARAALQALRPGVFPLGAQGAGRMAMQGGYFRCGAHSGQGGAFRQIGPTKIAAFVVVNAYGVVTDRDGRMVNCQRARSWGNLTKASELMSALPASLKDDWAPTTIEQQRQSGTTQDTTISLVVTNQKLAHWELQRLATQVHTSMARAIQPFATQLDGDTLFVASTQEIENKDLGAITLSTIAGETMWDAILTSAPSQAPFAPYPASVRAEVLQPFVGTYDFTVAKDVGDMRTGLTGLNLAMEPTGAKVVDVIEASAASTAGVLPGDVLTHINEFPTQGLSLGQVIAQLRGPVDSVVPLRIKRKDRDNGLDLMLTRQPGKVVLKARVANGKLVIEATGTRPAFEFELGRPREVVPSSDTEFYVDARYRTRIAFTKDVTGRVSGAILNSGLWQQKGVKLD